MESYAACTIHNCTKDIYLLVKGNGALPPPQWLPQSLVSLQPFSPYRSWTLGSAVSVSNPFFTRPTFMPNRFGARSCVKRKRKDRKQCQSYLSWYNYYYYYILDTVLLKRGLYYFLTEIVPFPSLLIHCFVPLHVSIGYFVVRSCENFKWGCLHERELDNNLKPWRGVNLNLWFYLLCMRMKVTMRSRSILFPHSTASLCENW